MPTFEESKAGYGHLWDAAKVASAKVDAVALATATAKRVIEKKDTFEEVEKATGVPWWWVGCTLYREADLNTGCYLGNGQSLSRVTTQVPAGRGPFSSFLAGAIDAIHYDKVPGDVTWTVERALYQWEKFNGFGYYAVNTNSPYVWNWTDLYHGGKYVADHQFDANAWDVQGGCAAILKELMVLDDSVNPPREGAAVAQKPEVVAPEPVPENTALLDSLRKLIVDRPTQVTQFVAKLQADLQAVLSDIDKFNATLPGDDSPKKGRVMNAISSSPVTTTFGSGAILAALWPLIQGIATKDPNQIGIGVMGLLSGLAGIFAKDGSK